MAKKPLKYMGYVEYADGTGFHKFTTSPKKADDWCASIMRDHGNRNIRVTVLEVLFSIQG